MVTWLWMFKMKEFIILVCLLSVAHARHENYEGHQLYEIEGTHEQIAAFDGLLDILSVRTVGSDPKGDLKALVALSPTGKRKWTNVLDKAGVKYKLMNDNLAEMFRQEEEAVSDTKFRAIRDGSNMTWNTYYRHDEINNYLDALAAEYPELVTVVNAGLSTLGRQIKYVRVSTTRFEDLRKPIVFIDAAIHAREWVSPPVALYTLQQLLQDTNGNLRSNIDWIILPIVNPDGYEYTHTTDRLWRKTLSTNHAGSAECPGVDANRNFDIYWGTVEANQNPCSIIYEGPGPFSEPETRIIRDIVLANVDRMKLYIALHSFGNMFLYAYGFNASLPSNGLDLHLTGKRMATAIDDLALTKANKYVVGNAAAVLYYTTGTARDWGRAVGVPLTYTLELPGYEYSFVVPPEYIEQIVSETWAGIKAGAENLI